MSEEVDKIDFIQAMSTLEIKDGDIIVLKSSERLSAATIDRLREEIINALSDNDLFKDHKILVLDNRLDIGVLRKCDN